MPAPEAPNGLRQWGQGLWDRVTDETTLDQAGYYILAEACREAKSWERADGIYHAMLARGFSGRFPLIAPRRFDARDAAFLCAAVGAAVAVRFSL